MLQLPRPAQRGLALEEAIARRRSARSFLPQSLSLSQLSLLLQSTAGVTGRAGDRALRAYPSAGALYPVEVYAAVHDVDGAPAGLYHYLAEPHALELVSAGQWRDAIADVGLGQRLFAEAPLNVVLTAVAERTQRKYKHLTSRFVALEVGHTAQNLLLQATSLGLGATPIGVFKENELGRLLKLDTAREEPLYLIGVGTPR